MSSAKCDWPVGKSHVALEGDFAIVFVDNIQTKRRLYYDLINQFMQIGQDKSLLGVEIAEFKGSETLDVVILECGLPTLDKFTKLNPCFHVIQCIDPDLLLETIQLVLESSLDNRGDCRLNTLIVENLSAFYWKKRCEERLARAQWYKAVNEKLLNLKSKYACNIVITMWDIEFERGFKSKPSNDNPVLTKSLSYTPNEVFLGCLYIVSYRNGDVFQYLDGAWTTIR